MAVHTRNLKAGQGIGIEDCRMGIEDVCYYKSMEMKKEKTKLLK